MRIITDSAADFTASELAKYQVTAVPLQVVFGEDCYEDGVTLTPDIFWSRLTGGENPKTSQPTPDAFLKVFEEVKASGEEAVVVLLSSSISGTVQSATLAKTMCEYDGIHIVDSRQAATSEKLLVLRACQLRDEGKLTAEEIAEALRRFTGRIRLYACLDTLDYLARGGRIPAAAAALGALVQLKVIVTINAEGKVAMAGKGMGMHRTTAAMLKLIEKHEIDERFAPIPLYTFAPDNCLALIRKLSGVGLACQDEDLSAVGATIATHVGPNVYGVAFVEAE